LCRIFPTRTPRYYLGTFTAEESRAYAATIGGKIDYAGNDREEDFYQRLSEVVGRRRLGIKMFYAWWKQEKKQGQYWPFAATTLEKFSDFILSGIVDDRSDDVGFLWNHMWANLTYMPTLDQILVMQEMAQKEGMSEADLRERLPARQIRLLVQLGYIEKVDDAYHVVGSLWREFYASIQDVDKWAEYYLGEIQSARNRWGIKN
jgi:hypothetical protein